MGVAKLAQEHRFLQAVFHFGVLQVGLEMLAPVFGAVADVFQVIGASGTDDVVCQQDAAFLEKATFLKRIGKSGGEAGKERLGKGA